MEAVENSEKFMKKLPKHLSLVTNTSAVFILISDRKGNKNASGRFRRSKKQRRNTVVRFI